MTALAAPFPYFGGKRRAARIVWDAIGGAGYSTDPLNGRRERLWLSPACNVHDQQVLIPEHGESLS